MRAVAASCAGKAAPQGCCVVVVAEGNLRLAVLVCGACRVAAGDLARMRRHLKLHVEAGTCVTGGLRLGGHRHKWVVESVRGLAKGVAGVAALARAGEDVSDEAAVQHVLGAIMAEDGAVFRQHGVRLAAPNEKGVAHLTRALLGTGLRRLAGVRGTGREKQHVLNGMVVAWDAALPGHMWDASFWRKCAEGGQGGWRWKGWPREGLVLCAGACVCMCVRVCVHACARVRVCMGESQPWEGLVRVRVCGRACACVRALACVCFLCTCVCVLYACSARACARVARVLPDGSCSGFAQAPSATVRATEPPSWCRTTLVKARLRAWAPLPGPPSVFAARRGRCWTVEKQPARARVAGGRFTAFSWSQRFRALARRWCWMRCGRICSDAAMVAGATCWTAMGGWRTSCRPAAAMVRFWQTLRRWPHCRKACCGKPPAWAAPAC